MRMFKRLLVVLAWLFGQPQQQMPLERIPQPPVANAAWNYVLSCTKSIGLLPSAGGNLANVKWFKTKYPHDIKGYILGEYNFPDSVVLDDRVLNQTDIVAHELLHHLMHIDPRDMGGSEAHPFVPFYAPCKLMASQTVKFDSLTGIITFRSNGRKLYPRLSFQAFPDGTKTTH